jgi:hypothetical protein
MVPNFMDTIKLWMKQGLEHQNRAKMQDDFTNNSNTPAYNNILALCDNLKIILREVCLGC